MGCSFSDEGKERRPKIANSTGNLKTIITVTSSQQGDPEKVKHLMKWKKYFEDVVSLDRLKELQQWNVIKVALLLYARKVPKDINLESINGLHFASVIPPTHYSNASDHGDITLVGMDQYEGDEFALLTTSLQKLSEIEEHGVFEERKNIASPSMTSPRGKPSNIFSSFPDKPSLRQEIKKILVSQLENPNQIVNGFINTFKSNCEELFGKSLEELGSKNYTAAHKETLIAAISVTKRFVNVLVKFISWIYWDYLQKFEQHLEKEDLTAANIIEDALFEVLFKGQGSIMYTVIMTLLEIKYRKEIAKFKQVLAQKKKDSLVSYDDVLQSSREFLLELSPTPYNEAIKKIRIIQNETNPYTKFELTVAVEEEMWNCVYQYYKDDINMISKLRQSFGMDVRMPILTYCMIQSQCEDLVIQRKFIQEFLKPEILDFSLGFTVFKGSIDFFLNDGNSLSLLHSTLSYHSQKGRQTK